MDEPRVPSRLKSKPSFALKNNIAKRNSSGQFARPIHRSLSVEKDRGMTDKLHSLMESYIPKDIESIQKG